MYDNIITVVNNNLKKYTNKNKILRDFVLGSPNFYLVLTDLKKFNWFKYKRIDAIEELVQQAIAKYIVSHF